MKKGTMKKMRVKRSMMGMVRVMKIGMMRKMRVKRRVMRMVMRMIMIMRL